MMQRLEANEYNSVHHARRGRSCSNLFAKPSRALAQVHELAEEINLVWNNAMTYNMDDSWIHKSAVRCAGTCAAPAGKGRWVQTRCVRH